MIELVNREEIFKSNSLINSVVKKMQDAFFDNEMLEMYKEDGAEMIYANKFDALKSNETYEQIEKVISIDHSDLLSFSNVLANKLTEIYNHFNVNKLICLSHLKLDIFGNRENKYEPLINSYDILEKITGSKSYFEAFEFEISDLGKMVEILFWLSRCDPTIAEYIYIFDDLNKTCSSICNYGNIHISEFKTKEIDTIFIEKLGMKIIEGQEYDQFSKDGNTIGREMKM